MIDVIWNAFLFGLGFWIAGILLGAITSAIAIAVGLASTS